MYLYKSVKLAAVGLLSHYTITYLLTYLRSLFQLPNIVRYSRKLWRTIEQRVATSRVLSFLCDIITFIYISNSIHWIEYHSVQPSKCYSLSPFHAPKQLPQLVLSPLFEIICHLQSEKRHHNLNFCADRMDIFSTPVWLTMDGYPAPLYQRRNWLWIHGAVQTTSNWLIDWRWGNNLEKVKIKFEWATNSKLSLRFLELCSNFCRYNYCRIVYPVVKW